MEAMKKEIARLNNIIASGCMDDASKKPKFIQGRHPFIKDGLDNKKGGKTGEKKMVNGVSCIRFKKETIGEVQPMQNAEAPRRNEEVPPQNVEVLGSTRTVALIEPRHHLDQDNKILKHLTPFL